jgi:hypothetical protein
MALVNLDSPPQWWGNASPDFMTANQARELVNTNGALPRPTHHSCLTTLKLTPQGGWNDNQAFNLLNDSTFVLLTTTAVGKEEGRNRLMPGVDFQYLRTIE